MKRFVYCAVAFVLCTGSLAVPQARSQTGSPTAPPPGGPNVAGISGPAGAARPAQPAGVTQPAGQAGVAQPAGGAGMSFGAATTAATPRDAAAAQIGQGFDAGFSRPSAGDRFSTPGRFGNSPGVFVPDPSDGSIRTPVSALPGRPNFSGGTNSATFVPAAPIAGGANPGNQVLQPNGLQFDPLQGDITPFNGVGISGLSTFTVPRIAVPTGVVPQATATGMAAGSASRQAPQVYVAPIPVPVDAGATADRNSEVKSFSATPVPAQLHQPRVATVTVYPDQDQTVPRDKDDEDVVETASTRSTTAARSDVAEIATGRRTVGYRGRRTATSQRNEVAYVYPGYTLWQGYYWYHSPKSGWLYWNGNRWTHF